MELDRLAAAYYDDEDKDILTRIEPDIAPALLLQLVIAENFNEQPTGVTEEEVDDDDSIYLTQLAARMSQEPISKEQIKRLKQRFHPSHIHPALQAWNHDEEDQRNRQRRRYSVDSEGGMYDDRPFRMDSDEDEYW